MVGRHGFDRGPRQDALAAILPVVQQHPCKGKVIVHRRDQTAAARWEGGRTAPLAAFGHVVDFASTGSRVGPIAGREPVEARGRHAKRGIAHAERLEQALAQKPLKRLARSARDQHAENIRAGIVHPFLARLVHQRQSAKTADPLVGRRRRLRLGHSLTEVELARCPLDRIAAGRRHQDAEAHSERQQVAQGDRPSRRLGVVERTVETPQNPAIGELGQQPVDGVV